MSKQHTPSPRRARMGRPPLPRETVRSERLVTYVTHSELTGLQKIADASGLSVSALCHNIFAHYLESDSIKTGISDASG
jgi:hypothetical protein